MEIDTENIINSENPGRVLRKRKRQSYVDKVVKRRTNNSYGNPRKRVARRHRSLDPPKIDDLSTDSHAPRPSTSTGSLESVIYLGFFRKVSQLIMLDKNNDSAENQGQTLFTEGHNTTPTTLSSKLDTDEEITSDQVPDNSWNEIQDTNNLRNLLSEMYVGATYKRIITRARTRECKH